METRWYVVLTAPQALDRIDGGEGYPKMVRPKAVRSLAGAGVEAYCPMKTARRKVWIRNQRRTYDVSRPLFPGYMFAALPAESPAFAKIRACEGVTGFVDVGGNPIPIFATEVERIRRSEDDGLFDFRETSHPVAFRLGDGVVIRDGFFDGKLATVDVLTEKYAVVTPDGTGFQVSVPVERLDKAS